MRPTTLYKYGVDPYTVHSQEELDYHLLQGWVEDPTGIEPPVAPPALTAPTVAPEPCVGCASRDQQIADLNEQIADLQTLANDLTARLAAIEPPNERQTTIMAAIKQIPREAWNRASGGRPAMPILADISKLTGFQVNAAEVTAVLPKLAEQELTS